MARRKRLVVAHRVNEMGLPADIDGDYYDLGGMWRIRRLHKSVLGFHEVLDRFFPCKVPIE